MILKLGNEQSVSVIEEITLTYRRQLFENLRIYLAENEEALRDLDSDLKAKGHNVDYISIGYRSMTIFNNLEAYQKKVRLKVWFNKFK